MDRYRVKFSQPPMGLALKGTPEGNIVVIGFDHEPKLPHLTPIYIGDHVVGCNAIEFFDDHNNVHNKYASHNAKVACMRKQPYPLMLHFRQSQNENASSPARTGNELWTSSRVKMQALATITRPVSKQRVGKSAVYKTGLTQPDVGDINTWFAEAKSINLRKLKEHRKLYNGKIVMRRVAETWNRPGMPFLAPIRKKICQDFLNDNIIRQEKRMMLEGAAREEDEAKKGAKKRQRQEKNRSGSEGGDPRQTFRRLQPLLPRPARERSLWDHADDFESHHRILTRGVKMKGLRFVLTVSRVRFGTREAGLRFVAHHVPSSTSTTCSSSCIMHMPWSVVTKALMEMGRVSLAERVLHCTGGGGKSCSACRGFGSCTL